MVIDLTNRKTEDNVKAFLHNYLIYLNKDKLQVSVKDLTKSKIDTIRRWCLDLDLASKLVSNNILEIWKDRTT